jgi:superfamily I DNA and/or RNA helicase
LDRDTVVATVPAYQGRDADVVVVSLVRDRPRGAPDRPWERIGYLTQPELINVMLSRARDLLVVVGRFAHFRDCGVDHWERVCACFGPGRPGTRLRATDVLPQ